MPNGAEVFDSQSSQGQGQNGPESHDAEESERKYTLSITEEDRRKSFEIEDKRWARDKQIGDWLKLGLFIVVDLAWMAVVYFLEPGLR